MRVGANVRQHAKIKKLLSQGVPPAQIARQFQMTAQSLERIIAHHEGRPMRNVSDGPASKSEEQLAAENRILKEKLAALEKEHGIEPGDADEEEEVDEDDD